MTDVEEYDPGLDQWTAAANMLNPRASLTAVAAGNGKIYAIGGDQVCAPPVNFVEEFTPATLAYSFHLLGTTISGNATYPEYSQIINSVVNGSLQVGAASSIDQAQVTGGLTNPGSGAVRNSNAAGISLVSGQVQTNTVGSGGISLGDGSVVNNTVTGGGISLGSGQALSNTLSGGGMSLGAGSYARFNNIQDCSGWGISAAGSVTLVKNRVVGCTQGVSLSGGILQGNLIANNAGSGLEINGDAVVISNTFTGNAGSAIRLLGGTSFTLRNNNLEGNKGSYDLENRILKTSLAAVNASQNWWGTTSSSDLNGRIFDFNDEYTLSQVVYTPLLNAPSASTPAYVRNAFVDPNPVGIEKGTFFVQFNREMNKESTPFIGYGAARGLPGSGAYSWWSGEGNANDFYGSNNGSLEGQIGFVPAVSGQGFSFSHINDGVFIPYNPNMDIQPSGFTCEFWMKVDPNQPEQYWTVIDKSHGAIDVAGWSFQGIQENGTLNISWGFGTGTDWLGVRSIANLIDQKFHHVAGTWDGQMIRLYVDGVLQGEDPATIVANNTRPMYFGHHYMLGRQFLGVLDEVTFYNRALTFDEIQLHSQGLTVTSLDSKNFSWPTSQSFSVSHDFTSLDTPNTYPIIVDQAVGTDGIPIAPNTSFTFTLDYAGAIGDTTPPAAPTVSACAGSDTTTLSASWSATDADSQITGFQYAIGLTPGGTEIVDWTFIDAASFSRTDLSLLEGQVYYVSVRARNAGGLWSSAATTPGVSAASGACRSTQIQLYLPLTRRK